MTVLYANNSYGKLASALAAADTIITLQAGEGERFPSITNGSGDWFPTTLGSYGPMEIVKVVARSGDVLTVERAQEGTTALDWAVNSSIELRLTKAVMEQLSPVGHGHGWDEVTDKPVDYPPSSHTHTPSEVGAAPVGHTHTPEEAGAAPAEHGHEIADVSGLQGALDGKSPTGHTHVPADVPGILELIFPVGSTVFRLDNRTPNECGFPGTWSKVAADVSLHTAAADGSNVGTSTGSNLPAVPVPQHLHTATQAAHGHAATQAAHTHAATQASHTHTGTTGNAGAHTHTLPSKMEQNDAGTGFDPATGTVFANIATSSAGDHAHSFTTAGTAPAITVPSVTPAITVPTATPAITVANAGTAGATLDVRGARIHGHLWHRTA